MKNTMMAAVGAVSLLAVGAGADVVNISGSIPNSTEATGCNFSGSIDYTYVAGNSGIVIINLDNDTSDSIGGYITGLVFNINSADSGAAGSLSFTSNSNFLDTGAESASPFGNFDAGAALGADWTGGGAPQGGIAAGGHATFQFDITASDASSLSAQSFLSGPNAWNFVVRFRGLANGGSDKVPGLVVPTPASAALLGLGGVAVLRRRR